MHRVAPALIAALLLATGRPAGPDPPGVVAHLHVVSAHVRDLAAFDAVFFLFRDVLRLPAVYGEPSRTGRERRLYAGFSVGNAYIEPCGPYETDAPFEAGQPARFHGLTFTSGLPLGGAARELDARGFAHAGLVGAAGQPSFIYLRDPWLTGNRQAISLWELPTPARNEPADLHRLEESLHRAKGGLLGVTRMAEVAVGYPDGGVRERWRALLAPAEERRGAWILGTGPSVRPVRSPVAAVASVVLEVESIDRASRALSRERLLGIRVGGRVELDRARTFGLRIELVQR